MLVFFLFTPCFRFSLNAASPLCVRFFSFLSFHFHWNCANPHISTLFIFCTSVFLLCLENLFSFTLSHSFMCFKRSTAFISFFRCFFLRSFVFTSSTMFILFPVYICVCVCVMCILNVAVLMHSRSILTSCLCLLLFFLPLLSVVFVCISFFVLPI